MVIAEAATTVLVWFGGGSLFGFVAGYAIKKIAKIAAIIIGVFALGVMYLSYIGIAKIDWQKAEYVAKQAAVNASTQVMHVVNSTAAQYQQTVDPTIPTIAGAGFLIGFLFGVKKG
jgi:uncharacterized membrane protein (Fun14 family)